MAELRLTLKTLTPLWTGGVDMTCDRLHETGIMGSLRWWYEAIVRGLGGEACDPTVSKCEYDAQKSNDGLCDACQVFGATGWRRRFRLEVEAEGKPAWSGRDLNLRPHGRNRGWYLKPGFVGQVHLRLTGDHQALAQMADLFRFLEEWGAIGARPQLGYGLFRIEDRMTGEGKWEGWQVVGKRSVGEQPDLRTFTFFRLRFEPRSENWWTQVNGVRQLRTRRQDWRVVEELAGRGMVPITPALKNALRFEQKWSSISLAQWLFGAIKGRDGRQRGRVGLSWAFHQADGWEIRGWVFVPQDRTGRRSHSEIERNLRAVVERPHDWFRALGVEMGAVPAQVALAPAPSPWRVHTPQEVADWLNGLSSKEE
jgi:CRISPR-associated protein Cmr1